MALRSRDPIPDFVISAFQAVMETGFNPYDKHGVLTVLYDNDLYDEADWLRKHLHQWVEVMVICRKNIASTSDSTNKNDLK